MTRIFRHLSYPTWRVRGAFPASTLQAIKAAISASEKMHDGELRFVVEGGLDLPHLLRKTSARQRAVEIFSQERIWDTEHNSGVLIYVQLADRQVEILADRGIDRKVGQAGWQAICKQMEKAFTAGDFKAGAIAGVTAIGAVLAEHFPAQGNNPNELPDSPLLI